jgi:chromosome segregation ATPase
MADQTIPTTIQDDDADKLAQEALKAASAAAAAPAGNPDEVDASNDLAQSLNYLQNVIERNATEMERLEKEMKEKRESLQSVMENDTELSTAEALAEEATTKLKERRAQMQNNPQVSTLKVQIKELSEQKKEVEETLSNHLINYFQITQSTSFDTSDGDQWDFSVKARVKSRKK